MIPKLPNRTPTLWPRRAVRDYPGVQVWFSRSRCFDRTSDGRLIIIAVEWHTTKYHTELLFYGDRWQLRPSSSVTVLFTSPLSLSETNTSSEYGFYYYICTKTRGLQSLDQFKFSRPMEISPFGGIGLSKQNLFLVFQKQNCPHIYWVRVTRRTIVHDVWPGRNG